MDAVSQLKQALGGRYEIDREIGKGGMATVYLARDPRHHRKVALKVLNPELGAVLGVERFLAEIQVTANLQHPNLLPLFDSGEADGLLFYVMPYVEGESLRGRLAREKQLPIDDAVHITTAVCSALDHAHRHGVIHRDLKPENILLHEGQPLVADFGIALAVSVAGGNRVTQTGISLGTPQYMSPEQATGDRPVDGRSDVYSLGCVLYEMLTGEPPHIGNTVQSIIAKVLTDKPQSVRNLRDTIPEHVDLALHKALAKLPADRWTSPAQFADALAGKVGVGAAAGRLTRSGATRRERWKDPLVIGLGAIALAAIATAAVASVRGQKRDDRPSRFEISLPPNITLDNIYKPLNISPDGRHIVFRVAAGGSVLIGRRSVDDITVRLLPGTENGGWPFVSPDSRWIAFLAGDQIRKVPLLGGPTVTITTIAGPTIQGATWAPDNRVVLGSFQGSPTLSTVSASGGTPRPLTRLDSATGEISQRSPVMVADGETVLYVSWPQRGLEGARIAVASLKSGESRTLDVAGLTPLGVVEGQLIYVRADGALMAAPFDLRRREVTGEPIALLDGINLNAAAGAARVALGGSTLVYLGGGSSAHLAVVDSTGAARSVDVEAASYGYPAYSPDGRTLALGSAGLGSAPDVWLLDLASSAMTRLTYDGGSIPMWTHDGKYVLFIRRVEGLGTVWRRVADGSAPAEKIFETDVDIAEAQLAPDGQTLIYRTAVTGPSSTQRDVFSVDLRDGKSKPLLTSRFNETEPRLSPSGKWLAYQSDESGTFQVYVRPFPGPGAVTQVSVDGGIEPVWSRDGRRLYYKRARQIVAASIATAPSFRVTARRTMFEGSFTSIPMSHPNYDVSPDGKEFVVLRTDESGQLTVVLNWTEELRQRLAR